MNGNWTDELVDKIKAWRLEGYSPGQMVGMLGGAFTRNAVIGKLSRLGVMGPSGSSTRTAVRSYPRAAPTVRTVAKSPTVLKAPEFVGPIGGSSPYGTCQWIKGDPVLDPDWQMCGQPVHAEAAPWCEFHHARAHQASALQIAAREASKSAFIVSGMLKTGLG